jgi:hypothetical protein
MNVNSIALFQKFCWKRYKFTILFGSTIVTILWLLTTIKNIVNLRNGNRYDGPVPVRRYFWEPNKGADLSYQRIPPKWLQREKCPACFGEDHCLAIEQDIIMLTVDETFNLKTSAFAFGTFRGKDVIVKRLGTNHYFDLYDRFVCGNSTAGCDVGEKAMTSYISSQKALLISELQTAYKVVKKSPGYLT